jgi:uncharacterized protein
MSQRSVLWRRLDRNGMEVASIEHANPNWHMQGTVLLEEGSQPCRLDYAVVCDGAWRTLWARVNGWVGNRQISQRLARNLAGEWRQNGILCPAVQGCLDVDLAFTPLTNLLHIRRLDLPIGSSGPVRAAWLSFPAFILEPLEQTYQREAEHRYHYESDGGSFTARLEVDETGLVTRYGDMWVAATVYREKK